MRNRFLNKYRISSARLKDYDYNSNGMYFVTICTKDKKYYFGNILIDSETKTFSLQKNIIGEIANEYWLKIPELYDFVELDEYVIMPNHMHGILLINKFENPKENPNKFGLQSKNLGSIIRGFKSTTKRFANQNNIPFEWLSRYHDRVIRNEQELNNIRQYIIDNPKNWAKDKLNMDI